MELGDNVNLYVKKSLFKFLRPSMIIESRFASDSQENINYVKEKYGDFIDTLFVSSTKYDSFITNGLDIEEIDNNTNFQKARNKSAHNTLIIVNSLDESRKYVYMETSFGLDTMEDIRIDYISDIKYKNKYGLYSINAKTFLGFLGYHLCKAGLSRTTSGKLMDILEHLNFQILVY